MSAFKFNNNLGWRNYVCGLYYMHSNIYNYQIEKTYLPQVELQAHTSILSTTSRTTLAQTFVNPSKTKGIKKVTYTFPLYDGVSVVGFTCHVGGRVIIGEVKEKEKARAVFTEAVARGETAALLEQLPDASDVFTTAIGNIPAGAEVVIHITYLGELKHDMEVDGIRFTIPNIICPRYGNTPIGIFNHTSTQGARISITVDVEMPDSSFIQQIRSPSHPIAINMGTTSLAPTSEPSMNKASASLSLGTAQLETDFVLQVIAKDTSVPKAIMETHPTVPNQRALMVTLVPKFSLPSEKPEIVFVCDRSGSMAGSRIQLVVQALKVFLKSLPIGVKFNICSFGSHYSFMWPKSVTYNQEHLDQAMRHADSFSGDYGGTEMLQPLKATIQQRYKDIPLEVILLTDGEIWHPEMLFEYLNQEITDKKAPIRIFTLGIGNGVSHSLIEGVAKAGNGFSQAVAEGEKMDQKVVRMLKGALSPHINDYTLEVKYTEKKKTVDADEGDDDYEIIEKVADSLKVKLHLNEKSEKSRTMKPISLFDTSINLDEEEPTVHDETGESRYAHLPKIAVPNIIQAPQHIPSLFAFNRTTVYLLFGPDAPQQTPRSVVLRGISVHGPLELEIPIQILDIPGETVHQLAAKKAISELEQGRGWLRSAKDESGNLVKKVFESSFEDMVEREAVRLGVQFGVGGKWCSFVAVEKTKSTVDDNASDGWLDEADISKQAFASNLNVHGSNNLTNINPHVYGPVSQLGALFGNNGSPSQFVNFSHSPSQRYVPSSVPQQTAFLPSPFSVTSSFGAPQSQQQQQQYQKQHLNQVFACNASQMAPAASPRFAVARAQAFAHSPSQMAPAASPRFGVAMAQQQQQTQLFTPNLILPGGLPGMPQQSSPGQLQGNHSLQDYQMQTMLLEQQNKNRLSMVRQEQDNMSHTPPTYPSAPGQPQGNHALQDYQIQPQLLEGQNRKRKQMAQREREQEQKPSSIPSASVPADLAVLELYQTEMASAAKIPLPDEDDEMDEEDFRQAKTISNGSSGGGLFGKPASVQPASFFGRPAPPTTNLFGAPSAPTATPFGAPAAPAAKTSRRREYAQPSAGGLFGGHASAQPSANFFGGPAPPTANLFGAPAAPNARAANPFGRLDAAQPPVSFFGASATPNVHLFGSIKSSGSTNFQAASSTPTGTEKQSQSAKPKNDDELLDAIIALQTFEGSWEWSEQLFDIIGISEAVAEKELTNSMLGIEKKQLATALAVAFLERRLANLRDVWELVVEKAVGWLGEESEKIVRLATGVMEKS